MGLHENHPLISAIEPRPSPPPSEASSFPILALSIVGILATAILLLSYYVFVIKCCLNWHRSDVLGRLTRSQRRWRAASTPYAPPISLYVSTVPDRGLDEATIQAIPTLRFMKGEQRKSLHECAVCLTEFQEEERIKMLPYCLHGFHIDCIDTWLQTHANCPLCRAQITATALIPVVHPNIDHGGCVVIEVGDEGSNHRSPGSEPRNNKSTVSKGRKLHKMSSFGDECIGVRGGKDEQFLVQPMRRSFSMDSSSDTQLYRAVQEVLRQNPHFREARNGEGTSGGDGRTRRSFFSFTGHCRSLRTTVLQIRNEQ